MREVTSMEMMEIPKVYQDKEWDEPPYNMASKSLKCLPVISYTWACMAMCMYHVNKAIESYNCLVE